MSYALPWQDHLRLFSSINQCRYSWKVKNATKNFTNGNNFQLQIILIDVKK